MAGQGQLAREVRTGLTVIEGGKKVKKDVDKLDELYYRKPVRQHVKEFACIFAIIFYSISAYQIYRGKPSFSPIVLILSASFLLFLGYNTPRLLYPFWKGWMKFAMILGSVMTVVLLGIAWMIVLIPVAIILKIIKKRIMNVEFKQDVPSYWEVREDKLHDFKLLDRQF